jgi:hypothetical protein
MAALLSPPMNGAYFNGLDQPNGLQTALDNIPGSVTTDYLLCSLNVTNTSPDINYGWNIPCVLASGGQITDWTKTHLCEVVRAGVQKGKCKRVWLVIGGAVDWVNNPQGTSAFTNIQNILYKGVNDPSYQTLQANFNAIIQALKSINGVESVGFDQDYEEDGDLASVVNNVSQFLFASLITFCPYSEPAAWTKALTAVNSVWPGMVVGYNLQTYSGGGGNNPKDWVASLKGTGVKDPDAFIWPIVSCIEGPTYTPDQVVAQLKNWVDQSTGQPTGFHSRGASLWASLGLKPQGSYTLTEYSKAIAQGICVIERAATAP